jgi:hypothetical protein
MSGFGGVPGGLRAAAAGRPSQSGGGVSYLGNQGGGVGAPFNTNIGNNNGSVAVPIRDENHNNQVGTAAAAAAVAVARGRDPMMLDDVASGGGARGDFVTRVWQPTAAGGVQVKSNRPIHGLKAPGPVSHSTLEPIA